RTYYMNRRKDTVPRMDAFQKSLRELKAARAQVQATRLELAKTEAGLEQRQQQLSENRKERARTLTALKADIRSQRNEKETLEADRKRLDKVVEEVEQAIASIP